MKYDQDKFIQECRNLSKEITIFYDDLNNQQKFEKYNNYIKKDALEIMHFILYFYKVHTTRFLLQKNTDQNTLAHILADKIMSFKVSTPLLQEYMHILTTMLSLEQSLKKEKNSAGIALENYIDYIQHNTHQDSTQQRKKSFFTKKPNNASFYNPFMVKNSSETESSSLSRVRSRSFIAEIQEQDLTIKLPQEELPPILQRKKTSSFHTIFTLFKKHT